MKRSPGLRISVAPVCFALAACAGVRLPRDQISEPGHLLFNGYGEETMADCFRCHSGDGKGSGRGPDLSSRVPELDDDELRRTILEGPMMMPAYKDRLSDDEIARIMQWLRAEFGYPADAS